MPDPKQDEIRSWLEKAHQDLEAASWLLESPRALNGAVAFHAQQAAEKILKAYLTWIEQPFEKTHSLVALVGLCLKVDADFSGLRTATTTLTPYAVTTRYPGDFPELSRKEAQEAISFAQHILDFVTPRLPTE